MGCIQSAKIIIISQRKNRDFLKVPYTACRACNPSYFPNSRSTPRSSDVSYFCTWLNCSLSLTVRRNARPRTASGSRFVDAIRAKVRHQLPAILANLH